MSLQYGTGLRAIKKVTKAIKDVEEIAETTSSGDLKLELLLREFAERREEVEARLLAIQDYINTIALIERQSAVFVRLSSEIKAASSAADDEADIEELLLAA